MDKFTSYVLIMYALGYLPTLLAYQIKLYNSMMVFCGFNIIIRWHCWQQITIAKGRHA